MVSPLLDLITSTSFFQACVSETETLSNSSGFTLPLNHLDRDASRPSGGDGEAVTLIGGALLVFMPIQIAQLYAYLHLSCYISCMYILLSPGPSQ